MRCLRIVRDYINGDMGAMESVFDGVHCIFHYIIISIGLIVSSIPRMESVTILEIK